MYVAMCFCFIFSVILLFIASCVNGIARVITAGLSCTLVFIGFILIGISSIEANKTAETYTIHSSKELVITDKENRVLKFDSKNNIRDYYYKNNVNAGFFIVNEKALDYFTEVKKEGFYQIKIGDVEYAIAHSAYAECTTGAATTAKVAAIITDADTSNSAFTLIKGVTVNVKFTKSNTAPNPTLNINSTGDKPIYYKGTAIAASELKANRICTFVYVYDTSVSDAHWEFIGTTADDTVNVSTISTTEIDNLWK